KESEQKNWLLQLMKDQPEDEATPDEGASDEGASDEGAVGHGSDSERAAGQGADEMSEPITPMLATLGARSDIRDEDEWACEMRGDGGRRSVSVTPDAVRVSSRNGKDMTATFPGLDGLCEAIDGEVLASGETVVAGEIIALDSRDRPSFSRLHPRLGL